MKKRSILLAGLGVLALASCSSSPTEDLLTYKQDNVSAELKTTYNLNDLSKQLYDVDTTASNYYKVFVAEDINSSLMVESKDLKEVYDQFGDRTEKITSPAIAFNTTMVSLETTPVINAIYNAEGLSKLNNEEGKFNGLDFVQDLTVSYSKSISAHDAYLAYSENKSTVLKTVYLPVRVERVNATNIILNTNILLPIYQEISVDGQATKADSFKAITFTYKSEEEIDAEIISGVIEDEQEKAKESKQFYKSTDVRLVK